MELTDKQVQDNRNRIIELLKSVDRKNRHKLLYFLDHSGYFYLYGSFKHHSYRGGLAQHSLEVLDYALEHNNGCDRDSIIITALLHDLCKTKYDFPNGISFYGHGKKSLDILDKFIEYEMTDEERNVIRYHMGSKRSVETQEEKELLEKTKNTDLWKLIHVGDCLSAGGYPKGMHGVVGSIIKVLS